MTYDFTIIKNKAGELSGWLKREYAGIRTSRAAPALLDSVMVESHGVKTPLKHMATITSENARTLRLTAWDKVNIKAIETAIAGANLGVSTVPDSLGLRVIFPELTSERRLALIKIIKDKLEEAKVSLRKEREYVWNDIQTKERAGKIGEDDKFRLKDELQKVMDEAGQKLEDLFLAKEEEIKG